MKIRLYIIAILLPLCSCSQNTPKEIPSTHIVDKQAIIVEKQIIEPSGKTIRTRINTPEGFLRTAVDTTSFGHYLRNLPLKPHGSMVKYFNGEIKDKDNVYVAVVDQAISNKDLQQCADAVMRLRGEYLFWNKDYKNLHFNFTNGFNCEFSRWANGDRVKINGNKTSWNKTASPSISYDTFLKYMDLVFSYAGSFSLSQELMPVSYNQMQIGDVLIVGGFPGHAVIVVDMAENETNGIKLYMLAQSYMPAQETQVLQNPVNKAISPWYELTENKDVIETPEWIFKTSDLKRFK
jgi:hypothetical protein